MIAKSPIAFNTKLYICFISIFLSSSCAVNPQITEKERDEQKYNIGYMPTENSTKPILIRVSLDKYRFVGPRQTFKGYNSSLSASKEIFDSEKNDFRQSFMYEIANDLTYFFKKYNMTNSYVDIVDYESELDPDAINLFLRIYQLDIYFEGEHLIDISIFTKSKPEDSILLFENDFNKHYKKSSAWSVCGICGRDESTNTKLYKNFIPDFDKWLKSRK